MEILNFKGPLLDLIYILKKGGSIHIKKKNRGKFTDYCGGKVTEECIAKGKKSKDPKIRKRATFAANARKWKHENGGIIKYQNPNSPLFNPHKIIENVPAREWGPRKINEDGTITEGNGTKFSRAPFQYWGNKGLGSQNEKLARDLVSEFDQMRSENPDYNYILDKNYQSYDDAINYLNHLEGLKKYLQIPYDTGLLMESEYKPTRLQGTNEKTYKFKSSTVPGYWDDVVDDMVIGEHDKNQYYDQSLNEFTAYRDRDEKGDFVSIYDEWDYNPAVRGGNKKLNKVVDSVTGGKPFVIYDRIYLDDHYDVPEEARGNPFITPAVVTANAKHENGGILKAQKGTPYGLPGGAPSYMQVQPFSPVGIALNQAKTMAKMKGDQQYLPPGVKEVVGPDGKKVAIRTEQPLVPLEQSIAEWLPGTGDVAEVGYIANDVKNGRYGSAALTTAMIALPGNVGKILRKGDTPPVSKLTWEERLGIPKGERNQPAKAPTKNQTYKKTANLESDKDYLEDIEAIHQGFLGKTFLDSEHEALLDWFNSPQYKERLVKQGFSEEQINNLLSNIKDKLSRKNLKYAVDLNSIREWGIGSGGALKIDPQLYPAYEAMTNGNIKIGGHPINWSLIQLKKGVDLDEMIPHEVGGHHLESLVAEFNEPYTSQQITDMGKKAAISSGLPEGYYPSWWETRARALTIAKQMREAGWNPNSPEQVNVWLNKHLLKDHKTNVVQGALYYDRPGFVKAVSEGLKNGGKL